MKTWLKEHIWPWSEIDKLETTIEGKNGVIAILKKDNLEIALDNTKYIRYISENLASIKAKHGDGLKPISLVWTTNDHSVKKTKSGLEISYVYSSPQLYREILSNKLFNLTPKGKEKILYWVRYHLAQKVLDDLENIITDKIFEK